MLVQLKSTSALPVTSRHTESRLATVCVHNLARHSRITVKTLKQGTEDTEMEEQEKRSERELFLFVPGALCFNLFDCPGIRTQHSQFQ